MNTIKIKTSYNKEYLTEFCKKNKITLIGDYENSRINRRICINAECVEKCGNIVSCDFRRFVHNSGRCNPCLYKKNNKIRYDKKYLREYCKLNQIELREDYTSIKVSRDTIIVAKCLTDNCAHNVEKTLRMIVEGGGCYCEECTSSNKCTKFKNTCLDRYGVENVSHDPEISERASKNAYKAYDYTFPSGRVDKIQGYEHFMLNDLLQKENIPEDDIVLGRNKVPVVNWHDEEDKVHIYFVDCFIRSQNRCIEAKSTWTAEKKKDCILLKQQALKDAGYLCEIWIYDHNGLRVECHL